MKKLATSDSSLDPQFLPYLDSRSDHHGQHGQGEAQDVEQGQRGEGLL